MAGGHAWQEACVAGAGVHGRGACITGGVHGGGCVHGRGGRCGMHAPLVNRMTDRCKNIILLQLRCGR